MNKYCVNFQWNVIDGDDVFEIQPKQLIGWLKICYIALLHHVILYIYKLYIYWFFSMCVCVCVCVGLCISLNIMTHFKLQIN